MSKSAAIWAGPPPPSLAKRRPLIGGYAWPERVRRRPILHDCDDDRISSAHSNETRTLRLMRRSRLNLELTRP
jgi:hypothetical protein